MFEKIAKIVGATLGFEDHGIMTVWLTVNYGGSGQGIGGYALDSWSDAADARVGTAYGMEWIIRILGACGVDSWEQVQGRTIIVLFDDDSWNAVPVGIKPLPTESGKPFIFGDLRALVSS